MDPHWHCPIVGTSIPMPDLRAAQVAAGVVIKVAEPTDYDVHATMVHLVSRERKVAKVLNKVLDRRHAAAIKRFAAARDAAALAALWAEALRRGDVAGALWAVMSHPAADSALKDKVFGEVHMLSHQVGSAARAELKRIHALEQAKAGLEARLEETRARHRAETRAQAAEIEDLRRRLAQELAESRRLAHAAGAAGEIDALKAMVEELRRHVALEAEGRAAAEAARREADRRAEAEAADRRRAEEALAEAADERGALERQLAAALEGEDPADLGCAGGGGCGDADLCGRCILFVGGRTNQVNHLRRIVEARNGILVHHDGGFEDGMNRLGGLLGQADTVMFPVDCVSHMAHDQVKRLCRRLGKPFVPVRHSGLGAFVRAIEQMGRERAS